MVTTKERGASIGPAAVVPHFPPDWKLERRVEQHNAGTASRYTRSRLPVTVEYQEEANTKGAALKRELAIKALSRQAKEKLIESVK